MREIPVLPRNFSVHLKLLWNNTEHVICHLCHLGLITASEDGQQHQDCGQTWLKSSLSYSPAMWLSEIHLACLSLVSSSVKWRYQLQLQRVVLLNKQDALCNAFSRGQNKISTEYMQLIRFRQRFSTFGCMYISPEGF